MCGCSPSPVVATVPARHLPCHGVHPLSGMNGPLLLASWLTGIVVVTTVGTVSTTNSGLVAAASGGTATNVYETPTAVSEYLMCHVASKELFLPYKLGPQNALDFPGRCVSRRLSRSIHSLARLDALHRG